MRTVPSVVDKIMVDSTLVANPLPGGQTTSLSEPLHLIVLALQSADAAKELFPDYRLTRLITARLQLDDADIGQLATIFGDSLLLPLRSTPRPFDHHLRYVIAHHGLEALFRDNGHAPYHHAIRPTGYDFYRDEVVPAGMEQWRADYRSMPDERQMMTASIIWLYRGGKDKVWLRRVPCTWHAADAIACMTRAGLLHDWVRLFALYPGW